MTIAAVNFRTFSSLGKDSPARLTGTPAALDSGPPALCLWICTLVEPHAPRALVSGRLRFVRRVRGSSVSVRHSRPKRGRTPLSGCVPHSVSPWDTRSRPLGGCESRGRARARLRVDTCFHPPWADRRSGSAGSHGGPFARRGPAGLASAAAARGCAATRSARAFRPLRIRASARHLSL